MRCNVMSNDFNAIQLLKMDQIFLQQSFQVRFEHGVRIKFWLSNGEEENSKESLGASMSETTRGVSNVYTRLEEEIEGRAYVFTLRVGP